MLIIKIMLYAFLNFFDNVRLRFSILIYCIILLTYLTFFEIKATVTISSINNVIIISETVDCSDSDAFNLNLSKTICD